MRPPKLGGTYVAASQPWHNLKVVPTAESNGAGKEGRKLAPFAAVNPAPADAGMWPAHPTAWLEPQLPLEAPAVSGLRVECRYTVPAPDLLPLEPSLAAPGAVAPFGAAPVTPTDVTVSVPASDLVPLGWDPRAACRKGDR